MPLKTFVSLGPAAGIEHGVGHGDVADDRIGHIKVIDIDVRARAMVMAVAGLPGESDSANVSPPSLINTSPRFISQYGVSCAKWRWQAMLTLPAPDLGQLVARCRAGPAQARCRCARGCPSVRWGTTEGGVAHQGHIRQVVLHRRRPRSTR